MITREICFCSANYLIPLNIGKVACSVNQPPFLDLGVCAILSHRSLFCIHTHIYYIFFVNEKHSYMRNTVY